MALLIGNYINDDIGFAYKVCFSIDNKKEIFKYNNLNIIKLSNEKHSIKILKGRLKDNEKTLDFSNGEAYEMKYYSGIFKSKVKYKKIDLLKNFNIDENLYNIFIIDNHNQKIWIPIISTHTVITYDEIDYFEVEREEKDNFNARKALIGYALMGSAGTILGIDDTEPTYKIEIGLNNGNKLLINNLSKEASKDIHRAFIRFEKNILSK